MALHPVIGPQPAADAAFLLAEADPIRACKVLMRGLQLQPRGGRQACVRYLVEEMLRADPEGLVGTLNDLIRIGKKLTHSPEASK